MRELKAYLDGASMAYKDTAQMIRNMIENCPPDVKVFMVALDPIALTCETKAKTFVYTEADIFLNGVRQ